MISSHIFTCLLSIIYTEFCIHHTVFWCKSQRNYPYNTIESIVNPESQEVILLFWGCGKCEMIFPVGFFPAEGFVCQAHPLYVRALTVGKVRPFVLVSIEMTSLPDEEISLLRAIAASSAATAPENVWITVTHSFSVPHIRPKAAAVTREERTQIKSLQTLVRDAVHTAVLQARNNIREACAELNQPRFCQPGYRTG